MADSHTDRVVTDRVMPSTWAELSAFQLEILAIAATDEDLIGREIKDRLEKIHGSVNHGRLYPNLDELVERDLLDKGEVDKRSNWYQTTDRGLRVLEQRRDWEAAYLNK